jgi:hypothetical protein
MDENGLQQTQMGQTSQFGGPIQLVVDNAKKRLIMKLPANLGNKDGRILGQVCGQEIFIDQVLIHEQLGVSKEGAIDVVNATFEEAKIALK